MKRMKHDWVQAIPEKSEETKTAAGIVLAATFKPTKTAIVVKSGPASDLKPKEVILHHSGAGITYEKNGKVFILLRDLASEIISVL